MDLDPIMALLSQDILGPRFFIREGWAPPAYDYHPILREDEEGANMPIGSTQLPEDDPASPSAIKPGESKEKGKKISTALSAPKILRCQ